MSREKASSRITSRPWSGFRKRPAQRDTLAQNELGVLYQAGHGVKQDYEEAELWYRKAADAGFALAQYNLGRLYAWAWV